MKVLFLHPNTPDYLISGLFHGLRTLLGQDCLDLPRFDCMYKPYTEGMRSKIRGKGFTLYGLLDDLPEQAEERFFIWSNNITNYDLYIIADIWNDWPTYVKLKRLVPSEKIVVIDPADSERIFPFNNYLSDFGGVMLNLVMASIPRNTKYFKREIATSLNRQTGVSGYIPTVLYSWLISRSIYSIGFSIPFQKVIRVSREQKTKMFVSNIVDEQVSKRVPDSVYTPIGEQLYKFDTEENYYKDIQISKYGITTKRGGWDCLRHYEYAANGTVLCFKNLEKKPTETGPFALDSTNCIIYNDYEDLMSQITSMSDPEYDIILEKSHEWIVQNTTLEHAKKFLKTATHQE